MRSRTFLLNLQLSLIMSFLLVPLVVNAQTLNESELKSAFKKEIYSIIDKLNFSFGLAFMDFRDYDTLFYNENESFPTASAIKIEILLHLLKEYESKNINIYDKTLVNKRVGGSGLLQYFDQNDLKLSYFNLAILMIQQSDNTATNILIEHLQMDKINQTIKNLNLNKTKLQRIMMDFEARKAGKENISTPLDKLNLLKIIYDGEILPDSIRKLAVEILSIPKETPLLSDINDEKIKLASKGGELSDVRCEMGIFYHPDFNYGLVIMTKNLTSSKDGDEIMKKISGLVYNYVSKKYSN